MPAITKAVLLNLGVFLAEDGLRRNVGSFAYNFTSPTASVNTNSFTLLPLEVFTWVTPMASSVLTLVSANGPLDLALTLRPAGGYSLTASRLHVCDSDVGQLVITNTSTTLPVQLTIVQA